MNLTSLHCRLQYVSYISATLAIMQGQPLAPARLDKRPPPRRPTLRRRGQFCDIRKSPRLKSAWLRFVIFPIEASVWSSTLQWQASKMHR